MKLIKIISAVLTIISILVLYRHLKKRTRVEKNTNEGTQPIVEDAAEKMSVLTTEISNSIDNLTEIINKHRDNISDIYLRG